MKLENRFGAFVQQVGQAVQAGYLGVAKELVKDIQQRAPSLGRFKASLPGSMPNRRRQSGGLYGTLQAQPRGASALVTSGVLYWLVLELGKTIFPVRKKALTIPLNTAAARFSETKGMQSLRAYNFSLRRTRKGKAILVGGFTQKFQYYRTAGGKRQTVRDEGVPVFLLARSSTIRPRPFIRPALARFQGARAWQAFSQVALSVLSKRFPDVIMRPL